MHVRTKYKIFFGVTIVLAALYLVTDFKSVPDADATGGAFTSTKHGGADVDSEPNDGVDRSVHPDVGAFYYDDAEAGEYEPGECNHCHEPHASFGGGEPPPDTTGPHVYLLFRDNDNDLCWYCHENINFDPIFGGGVGRWRFYQGETIFTASSHGLSTSFTWPGDDGLVSPSTIWPRDRVRPNADRYKCINCHTPHGILGASGNVYDSDAVPASVQSDTAKPAIETAYLIPRQAIAWEEALCLNCHDSGGPALQGGSQFTTTNVKEQLTKTYNHPVTDTTKSGIHNLKDEDNPSTGWFSSNVHSECTDCHNPHVAGGYGSTSTTFPFGIVHQPSGTTTWNTNRGTRTQPVLVGPVNEGAWGIDVTESSGSIGSRIDALSATFGDKLYNLCLKCHSSFGMTANSVASSSASDLATDEGFAEWTSLNENRYLQDLEDNFKTSNTGYHPVFGQGKNLPSTGANSNWSGAGRRDDIKNEFTLSQTFVPPWRHTDTVTCVDCHEDEASTVGSGSPSYSTPRGPHGSSRYFILRELDCNITYDICDDAGCTTTSTIDYSTYLPTGGNASFNLCNATNGDFNNFCVNCHRADVYGYLNTKDGSNNAGRARANFSRQIHSVEESSGKDNVFNTDGPRGIVCLHCHGSWRKGLIHGGNSTDHSITVNCDAGASCDDRYLRLLTGAAWSGWDRGTTSTQGGCFKNAESDLTTCGHGSDGDETFDNFATYDYP